jgi:fructan beta-fructosidase
MFVDGVLMSEASPVGPLREGNTEPCLIGAESVGANIKAGWKGQIDHVAIWNRALSDAEIEGLSGGAERIAAARKRSDAGARTFTADKRYLVFPCSRGLGGQNKVFINGDGKPYMSVYDALIASSNPDHWRCIDLKLMQGKTLSVKIEGPNAAGIELVKMSDTMPGKYPVYQEPGRPKVHFSPIRGWLNDPCGMIYYEGTWHFYYANSRFNNVMAGPNNAWGHATSTDLLHWEEQPIFLTPIRRECSFWTGGAAVDVENTTGLGRPGKPAIVYSANCGNDTPHDFTQCVFVSTDGGMTAIRNPEMMYKPLPKEDSRRGGGTRDPMILWYAPEKKWVMVFVNTPPGRSEGFYFYESRDLKNWAEISVFENTKLDCPNIFQIPVDGNKADMRWVMWPGGTCYWIGKFNGKAFVPDDNRRFRTHYGQFNTSQVFANGPDGRVVQIGWAHCCNYDAEFSQMASFPLELSLRTTPEGLRLYADFVPELAKLRSQGSRQKDVVVKAGTPLKIGDISQPAEIIAEFEPGSASRVTFTGAELNITWNAQRQELRVKEVSLPAGKPEAAYWEYDGRPENINLTPKNGRVVLHILLDIPSVEVVSGGGESYSIKGRDYRKLGAKSPMEIRVDGGDVTFSRLEVYPLQSIH